MLEIKNTVIEMKLISRLDTAEKKKKISELEDISIKSPKLKN